MVHNYLVFDLKRKTECSNRCNELTGQAMCNSGTSILSYRLSKAECHGQKIMEGEWKRQICNEGISEKWNAKYNLKGVVSGSMKDSTRESAELLID